MWVVPLLCNVANIVLWLTWINEWNWNEIRIVPIKPVANQQQKLTLGAPNASRVSWKEDTVEGAGSSASLTQSAVNILREEEESCSTTAGISWTKVLEKLFPRRGAVLLWSWSWHFYLFKWVTHERPTSILFWYSERLSFPPSSQSSFCEVFIFIFLLFLLKSQF